MYTILDHLELTRRKRVTHVLNERGGLMWSGASTGKAVEYLIENGRFEARLEVGDHEYELNFKRWPI